MSELAEEHDLGGFRQSHPVAATYLVRAVVTAVVSVGFAIGGPAWYLLRPWSFDAVRVVIGLWVAPALGLAVACVSAVTYFRLRSLGVQIHERGLVVRSHGTARAVAYSSIEALRSTLVRVSTQHGTHMEGELRLTLEEEPDLVIDARVWEVSAVWRHLVDATAERHLAIARSLIAAGHPVPFGRLQLRPDGLAKGNEVRPWTELEEIGIERHRLVVRLYGGRRWLSVPLSEIPNAHLFTGVAAQLRGLAVDPPLADEDLYPRPAARRTRTLPGRV